MYSARALTEQIWYECGKLMHAVRTCRRALTVTMSFELAMISRARNGSKKIRYSHVTWQVNFHSHLSTLSSINTFPIQLLRSRSNYNKSSLAHLCGGMETWLKAKSQWLRIVSSGRRQDPSFKVTWYGRHRSIIYQGDRLGSFAPGPPFEQLDVLAHYLLSSRSISE